MYFPLLGMLGWLIPLAICLLILTSAASIILSTFVFKGRMSIPSPLRVTKWLFLIIVYFPVSGLIAGVVLTPLRLMRLDGLADFLTTVSWFLVFMVFGFIVWALNEDKEREKKPSDDFVETRLFFRYGNRINQVTIPIELNPEWTSEQETQFAANMQQHLAARLRQRFSSSHVDVIDSFQVKDRDKPADNRLFMRILYHSVRGSQVCHFVRYEPTGRSVVAHYFSFVRGVYVWHDMVDFVITGPFHVWFWIIAWFKNQYSIVAGISKYINNSFDQIDLETFFDASYFVILSETRAFLKKEGLLSEELERVITYNIDNSQKVSISGSQGISLGNIASNIQQALGSSGKPG